MKDEMFMYVRNKQNTPKGVLYFKKSNISTDIIPVVTVGWSKANKTDTFKKAFGVNVAKKRAEKGDKFISKDLNGMLDVLPTVFAGKSLEDVTPTVPFIIKKNVSYYLENAKTHLGVSGDVVFVFPVLETVAISSSETGSSDLVEMMASMETELGRAKMHTQTRYIKIIH